MSVLILLITPVLCFIVYNLNITQRGHRHVKDLGLSITRDLNDLRRTYETTSEMEIRNALKNVSHTFNQSTINVVPPSASQPSVEVGGDATINVHKTLCTLSAVPASIQSNYRANQCPLNSEHL